MVLASAAAATEAPLSWGSFWQEVLVLFGFCLECIAVIPQMAIIVRNSAEPSGPSSSQQASPSRQTAEAVETTTSPTTGGLGLREDNTTRRHSSSSSSSSTVRGGNDDLSEDPLITRGRAKILRDFVGYMCTARVLRLLFFSMVVVGNLRFGESIMDDVLPHLKFMLPVLDFLFSWICI